ncbi:MAG: LL-diaminopimelate aminotransferase [Fibrobacterota bacterium]
MVRINENFNKLQASYLFADIARKVEDFQKANPDTDIIKLGIGDVTRPLPEAIISAMHKAVDDMGSSDGFHGYGPEQGYAFLREAVAENDYTKKGCDISPDEIFISDGSKCDSGNIQEIFSADAKIAIPDPVYPVYLDTNVMAGRTGEMADGRYEGIVYLDGNMDNGFVPELPEEKVDVIYLCYPNNPTGATATKDQLAAWVNYARENDAVILFDAAYEAFITDESLPRSIYEIPGAREVAIEFRSFSKTAGFTGTRCAFTVVPRECRAFNAAGEKQMLHPLWNRRHNTKFNGVSYVIQKGAEAVYSAEGQKQVQELIAYYLRNARMIRDTMNEIGLNCVGGENSPYIWIETEGSSWELFDTLLNKAGVVTTPGAGFGKCGEGFIRISAFNDYEKVEEALTRIKKAFQ